MQQVYVLTFTPSAKGVDPMYWLFASQEYAQQFVSNCTVGVEGDSHWTAYDQFILLRKHDGNWTIVPRNVIS